MRSGRKAATTGGRPAGITGVCGEITGAGCWYGTAGGAGTTTGCSAADGTTGAGIPGAGCAPTPPGAGWNAFAGSGFDDALTGWPGFRLVRDAMSMESPEK